MANRRPYLFTWRGGVLHPFDADCEARLGKYHEGTTLKCVNLVQPRSLPLQGFYWATLTNIVEATEIAADADHLHEALVRLCGYVSIVTDVNGKPVDTVRDSTAFDAMDEQQFSEYVAKAQKILAERFGIVWDDYTRDER